MYYGIDFSNLIPENNVSGGSYQEPIQRFANCVENVLYQPCLMTQMEDIRRVKAVPVAMMVSDVFTN